MPAARRLTPEEVKGYSNERLVGDFEVAIQTFLDNDPHGRERERKEKNVTVLRDEMYHRMRHPRSL